MADPEQPERAARANEPQTTGPLQYALVKPAAFMHPTLPAPPLASFLGLRSLSSTLSFVAGDFFLAGIFFRVVD
jgi:hypothetical protein